MTNPTLTSRQVTEKVEDEQKGYMPVLPLTFIQINQFTTFALEFAVTEGDIVFHFYVTDEVNALPDPKKYWLEQFPEALQTVVSEYFKATYPRIKAAYTEEKASWWMRAAGFGLVLDPHTFTYRFLDLLDAELDKLSTISST